MTNQNKNKFLIIGYGNSLRNDDQVGQIIAQKIEIEALPQVKCIYQHQLTPELAEKIAIFSNIIFIDACVDNNEVTTILLPRSAINNKCEYGHYCTPEYLLYLTKLIHNQYPKSYLITIPVNNIDLGEELSDLAKEGIKIALKIIKEIINKIE
ncbi:NADH-reducing hydrogenase maturation factor [Geminocystis sp. NIES-3708]|uniref:hydrogenase maturation protease n=1 Tax=Geminocystis sp. NIES-3708 TaxID=1615909 RepID=UPI0005FC67D7|nr:hydrogenase maturation protease [Geminocystis sp. NIES-3708]BAQ61243.1 NADH-reducing hydrogenase maturation factor [Geminocystis sp. NIES-3708]